MCTNTLTHICVRQATVMTVHDIIICIFKAMTWNSQWL